MNIDEAEKAVDSVLPGIPFDASSLEEAQHVLLSAVEDRARGPLILGSEPVQLPLYFGMLDGLKYALKYALAEIMSRGICAAGSPPKLAIDADAYRQAMSILDAGRAYQAAVAAFTGYRSGKNTCALEGSTLRFRPADDRDVRFRVRDALESMLGTHATNSLTPMNAFMTWMVGPPPQALLDDARRTTPGPQDTISCQPSLALLRDIFESTAEMNQWIPATWTGGFGTGIEVARVLHGLASLCLAHALLVNSGSAIHGVRGVGLHSLLLRLPVEELVKQLALLSGASAASVRRVVSLLTYATSGVESPDPALQPLIQIGQELVACPLLVCSSDLERNFLALLARVSRSEFDAASHVFEVQMTERLKDSFTGRPFQVVTNRALVGMKSAGEVDALILDPASKTALLLELWWTIPPSEAQEVLRRERNAVKKGEQAEKKLLALREHLPAVLSALGVTEPKQWTAEALLVTDGFLPSNRVFVTIVTLATLKAYLKRHSLLSESVLRLASEEWLPVLDEHYETLDVENTGGPITFSTVAFTITPAGFAHAAETLR